MPTFRDYRHETARKFGGFKFGTVSLDPDPLDQFAQRQILSAGLYDADKGSKGFANEFAYVGKYLDQRRFRESGYRSLAYAVFVPPTSGTYTLTCYGYGTSTPIQHDVVNPLTIQAAIVAITAGTGGQLASATVSGTGNPFVISLPDVIDVEISNGTMIATGGIGAIEVQRSFSHALLAGDEFECHSKMPVLDDDNLQGLNTIINMALRRMWFIDRFPITPVVNSRGIKTFYGLTDEPWLTRKQQVIALYDSTLWQLVATYTPPGSGSSTLTLTNAPNTYITASLPFTATGQNIQDAFATAGIAVTVAPLTLAASYTITLAQTYYAVATVAASSGTVTNARIQLEECTRYPQMWSFEYDGETPYIRGYYGREGYSFYLESYRPAQSWICPQASYGVLGDTWVYSADGLTNDYDQAVPTVEDVAAVAYALGCRHLATTGPAHDQPRWEQEARRAESAAAVTKLYDLPFNDKPTAGRGNARGNVYGNKGFWWL